MKANGTASNGTDVHINGNGVSLNGHKPECGQRLGQAELSDAGPALGPEERALHRIAEVRRQQGISLRTVSRHLHRDSRQLKHEEEQTTDLPLSVLYQWQEALDVPVTELLVESTAPLSTPVMERARLVKLMKTVAAIMENAESASTRRLAQTLADQLIEIMPELEGVSPWPTVGHRRSLDDYGRAVDLRLASDAWRQP